MSRRLEHPMAFAAPPETVYAAFAGEDYWQALMARYREHTQESEITAFTSGADGVDVAFRQVLSRSELPGLVRTIIPVDMIIERHQHFNAFNEVNSTAAGHFAASVPHVPGRLDGTYALSDASAGSRLLVTGRAKVSVPLVGGKLEKLVLDFMKNLLTLEEAFTADWIAQHS
ncbi:DUF2505 domain-containing protein [Mycolicibacterium goodii]|uniref:DUF2505 domain-containing protein n=1 Tax=Mycolicibacterium goodii TaxID=134601 RepID=UPI001F04616F|nr:DUF2505 domain-containing protein [Mycolicibacterium goodii]ULN48643.1 DUF2505 domain-containing protein [Mycolicibacterium goodii]